MSIVHKQKGTADAKIKVPSADDPKPYDANEASCPQMLGCHIYILGTTAQSDQRFPVLRLVQVKIIITNLSYVAGCQKFDLTPVCLRPTISVNFLFSKSSLLLLLALGVAVCLSLCLSMGVLCKSLFAYYSARLTERINFVDMYAYNHV